MNSRRGFRALSAIVSLLWLAATSDSRAAEERPASFDCAKDRAPLALIVCRDQSAILAERRTAIAYLAFYFSLDENGRARFRSDHLHWVNDLTAQCTASPSTLQKLLGVAPTALSRECVTRAYLLRAETYRRKLHGSALEEANLSPNELRNIQRRLVELKLLSGSIDGTFGVETRRAIRNYQSSINHDQANFLTAEERNMLLAPASTAAQSSAPAQPSAPAQASISAQTPMGVSESAPEVPPPSLSPQPSAGQSNQNPESRLPNMDATTLAAGQSIGGQVPPIVFHSNRSATLDRHFGRHGNRASDWSSSFQAAAPWTSTRGRRGKPCGACTKRLDRLIGAESNPHGWQPTGCGRTCQRTGNL